MAHPVHLAPTVLMDVLFSTEPATLRRVSVRTETFTSTLRRTRSSGRDPQVLGEQEPVLSVLRDQPGQWCGMGLLGNAGTVSVRISWNHRQRSTEMRVNNQRFVGLAFLNNTSLGHLALNPTIGNSIRPSATGIEACWRHQYGQYGYWQLHAGHVEPGYSIRPLDQCITNLLNGR